MKKISLFFAMLCVSGFMYSQENELTDEQKEALRKDHKSGLTFSRNKTNSTKQLSTSNTTEETHTKNVNVSYYYGKKDSTFKKISYIKP